MRTSSGRTESAVVACDADATAKYVVGPVEIQGIDITIPSQQDSTDTQEGWRVALQLTSAGTARFRAMITRLAGLTKPQNQLAMVLDGVAKHLTTAERQLCRDRERVGVPMDLDVPARWRQA